MEQGGIVAFFEATALWLICILFDKNCIGVIASASSWYTHL